MTVFVLESVCLRWRALLKDDWGSHIMCANFSLLKKKQKAVFGQDRSLWKAFVHIKCKTALTFLNQHHNTQCLLLLPHSSDLNVFTNLTCAASPVNFPCIVLYVQMALLGKSVFQSISISVLYWFSLSVPVSLSFVCPCAQPSQIIPFIVCPLLFHNQWRHLHEHKKPGYRQRSAHGVKNTAVWSVIYLFVVRAFKVKGAVRQQRNRSHCF